MNEQFLLAANNYGNVFALSTFDDKWKRFVHDDVMVLKHVSAVENYVWSIGGDNQTYLLVHGVHDGAIRVEETVYENEVSRAVRGKGGEVLIGDRRPPPPPGVLCFVVRFRFSNVVETKKRKKKFHD